MHVSVCVNEYVYVFVCSVQKYCEFVVYLLISYKILPVMQNISLTFSFEASILLELCFGKTLL